MGTNDTDRQGTMCAGIICSVSFEYSENLDSYTVGQKLETFPPGIPHKAKLVVYKNNTSTEVICAALQDIKGKGDIDVVSLFLGSLAFTFPIVKAVSIVKV